MCTGRTSEEMVQPIVAAAVFGVRVGGGTIRVVRGDGGRGVARGVAATVHKRAEKGCWSATDRRHTLVLVWGGGAVQQRAVSLVWSPLRRSLQVLVLLKASVGAMSPPLGGGSALTVRSRRVHALSQSVPPAAHQTRYA